MASRLWRGVVLAGVFILVAGCGAKHKVGDTVVYDPAAEEGAKEGDPTRQGEDAVAGNGAGDDGGTSTRKEGAAPPSQPTEAESQKGQFIEAEGTSMGGEDWVAEIHREGERLWLISPFGDVTTYAMVRAATFLQGLRLAEEDFDRQRFTTRLGYKAWHGDNEGGFALTMKILTKGFGRDSRYRFRVAVESLPDGGSRVNVRQFRQVMEEEPHEDVGDWVEAEKPEPAITRAYLEGVQRALGD